MVDLKCEDSISLSLKIDSNISATKTETTLSIQGSAEDNNAENFASAKGVMPGQSMVHDVNGDNINEKPGFDGKEVINETQDEGIPGSKHGSGLKENKAERGGKSTGDITLEDKNPQGIPGVISYKELGIFGMIFMCNSQTKMDCFQYNVFGLPENKRETVSKIYKGMMLFLYDIDLRLLYGIYKAVSRGGFKLEPKAFNSRFPSQVRFMAHINCLPLHEDQFKTIIKDNYYKKNRFNPELREQQVKSLCKVFRTLSKAGMQVPGQHFREQMLHPRALCPPPRVSPPISAPPPFNPYARDQYAMLMRPVIHQPEFIPMGAPCNVPPSYPC